MFLKKKMLNPVPARRMAGPESWKAFTFPFLRRKATAGPLQTWGQEKKWKGWGVKRSCHSRKGKIAEMDRLRGGLSLFEENKISLQWRWRRKIMRRRRKEKLMD